MRKSYKVNGIDCANCAAKLERNIAKIKGVESCAVVFATQKLILEAADDKFDAVLDEAIAVTKKLEPSMFSTTFCLWITFFDKIKSL